MENSTSSQACASSSPILISFSGMDGSGKSTQIEQLCLELAASGLSIQRREFWNHVVAFPSLRADFSRRVLQSDGTVGTPEKPANRNDKNARKWYLVMGRHVLYLLDAFKLRRAVARARRTQSEVIIFDRYIYDQLATLPIRHSFTHLYVRMVLKFVPKPDIAYVLDAVPEVARARKPEYPLEFMHRYRAAYLRLADIADLHVIPPLDIEQAHRAILQKLGSRLQREFSRPDLPSAVSVQAP